MKLASLKSSTSRDGILCVVNQSLTRAICVPDIAKTLQYALDNWDALAPKLNHIYQNLNEKDLQDAFAFNPEECSAPLPRAYQWIDGSAYVNHVALVRKARGAVLPENFWTDPLMYQGGSDTMLGPRDPIFVAKEAYGIDFEAEVAIITDDVPMGVTKEQAQKHIKLLMLVNDISLRNLVPEEIVKGFGFFQSKPSCSFSPVAITPDELAASWDGHRVHLPLMSYYNETLFGQPNAGVDMTFGFPELIAHAAKTRQLCTGTIIGSGTVSNLDREKGSSCITERRMLELINEGEIKTPFMHFGDRVCIKMNDAQGKTLFGEIIQTVVPYSGSSA
jgi:fumarylacetoacetate (FAA) hydrolase